MKAKQAQPKRVALATIDVYQNPCSLRITNCVEDALATEDTRSVRKAHVIYKAADGERLPGTTTIVGLRHKDLTGWAFRLGQDNPALSSIRDYTDDLARIGSLVHHYAECTLKGITPDTDDWTANEIKAASPAFRKFEDWLKGKRIKVLMSEGVLTSEKYRYGGTIDIYAEVDDVPVLIDLKTGKNIYREYFYQTSGYAQLLIENGFPVQEIRILRVGRVGSEGFEERRLKDWSLYLDAFLSLRALYATEKQIDKFEAAGGV